VFSLTSGLLCSNGKVPSEFIEQETWWVESRTGLDALGRKKSSVRAQIKYSHLPVI